MKQFLFSRRSFGLGGAIVVVLTSAIAGPALASPPLPLVDTSACVVPRLSQPFLAANDSNWYRPVPVNGVGWTLSGGARLTTTTLADDRAGLALDLPSGSTAVSPTICVDSSYPTARTRVRQVVGKDDLSFGVSYAGTKTWATPKNTGHIRAPNSAWTLADPLKLNPGNRPGWQLVRFTFTAGSKTTETQIYDFYVDPRMH